MTIFFNSNKRKLSTITLVAVLFQVFYPTTTYALTGGPSQIEYENFEPAGATEMVNLATGDFVYNIPLLDVDGYPINISYHGGVGMEQESGWVGLGWSLNPGAITRGLRGLPDDFNGGENDVVKEEINIKENRTWGLKIGGGAEVAGFDFATLGVSANTGITYNNYKGLGLEFELGVSGTIQAGNLSASGNLGVSVSSQDGADFTMSGGLGVQASISYQGTGVGASLGINRSQNYNSRRGLVSDIISGSAGANISVYGATYGKTTGSAINLIPNTAYVPNIQYSTNFSGITGEIKVGGEFWWCNVNGSLRGYAYEQKLESNYFSKKAFGYLNLENAGFDASLDFNRDNEGVYYTENPKLPFTTLTYDLFNANAQGLNELFRPYRNDFGAVYDNYSIGGGEATDVGLEVNIGGYAQAGMNEYGVTSSSSSGAWTSNNMAYNLGVNFKKENQLDGNNNGRNTYEHSYFKALDELTIEDPTFYNSIKGNEVSSFKLIGSAGTGILRNQIISNNGASSVDYHGETKNNRQPRNSNMSYLTANEASKYGLNKQITNYTENVFNYSGNRIKELNESVYPKVNRDFGLDMNKVGHHISEVTVLKEDGSRYFYGLPVYNRTQKEVMFNCNSLTSCSDGIVNYSSVDNSTGNQQGRDNFFHAKTLPAYAHSYLLTALVSKDYVDINNDGLSNDDLGDYTKFNYSRVNSNYEWRVPVSTTANKATYNPASFSESNDDKGMFVYGSREQWYTHSIETKNYIAEFHTSVKSDGLGVNGEDGAISSTNTQRQLDKIVLYAKTDLSTPIKTVNFKYDYSLCKNTPNSSAPQKGKLTLTKIYFTYGKSDKGVFSPYEFVYADLDHDGIMDASANPDYNRLSMDRWGVYKPNSGGDIYTLLNNETFPYTLQKDSADANTYAAAWNLSSITTPAGSKIDVTYETDDYSYIQDQTPSQMLDIGGFSNGPTQDPSQYSSNLYNTSSTYNPNNYMLVDLSKLKGGGIKATSLALANSTFINSMLPSSGKVYFKAFVQIASGTSTHEYVPGYADIEPMYSAVCNHPSAITNLGGGQFLYTKAYIKLKDVDIEDPKNYANDNCNPISKAGWQIARLYHPGLAYPGSEPGDNGLDAIGALGDAFTEVFTFKEKNNRLRKKGYSSSINPAMSFVRLTIPTKTKIGGGHRVSKIEINDNWNNMVNTEASTTYGQTYNYSLKNISGTYLSSGVAAYEPLAGGDEISMRKPIEYSVARIAAPDDAHFSEEPVGEAFYPQPTVIYSKITVRNLDRKDVANNLITSNIGRTEYQFYTAKDFPISSEYDALQNHIYAPDPDGNLFSNYAQTATYLSQGFILRLNNMHGKLKSVLSYQEGNDSPISGTKYTYKTTGNSSKLDNTITTIDETGTISNSAIIGQHVEPVADFRQSNTVSNGTSTTYNLNVSPLPVPPSFPLPIPSYFTGSSTEVRDFGSATLNKVVTQQGILEKIETISNYASSTTENLVWDAKTTSVVLSRTTTNYKNYDYSYETPAHWVYKGMGGAFQNLGLGFKNIVNTGTGVIAIAPALLQPGDEVKLIGTNGSNNQIGEFNDRLWISKNSSGALILTDRMGKICNTTSALGSANPFATIAGATNFVLIVIKSGYKNIIDESVEEISFSEDPRSATDINKQNNVIDASATEFSDDWQSYCPYFGSDKDCGSSYSGRLSTNPYILNTKGNWNEARSYSYLGKRLSKDQSNSTFNIRKDGTFEVYKPFFSYYGGTWETVYNSSRPDYNVTSPFDNWILNSEITKISPEGNVLEAKDALNRFSSSLFGYNRTFKTATAINGKYRDIGFDNFEDYDFGNRCVENHFNFNNISNIEDVTANWTAHTGRHSMTVRKAVPVIISKVLNVNDPAIYYGSNNSTYESLVEGTVSKSCALDFSPLYNHPLDQKYVLSVWVKEKKLNKDANYIKTEVQVGINGVIINTLIKKSAIINGWQKFDYEFTIPANSTATILGFSLINNSNDDAYFDDIRVHPFNAAMNSYVYDPTSLRLWAELDERNFATFYEYDNEGVLVRVKKETEKGIITIKETRNSLKKH